jgi:hypothetical protein
MQAVLLPAKFFHLEKHWCVSVRAHTLVGIYLEFFSKTEWMISFEPKNYHKSIFVIETRVTSSFTVTAMF